MTIIKQSDGKFILPRGWMWRQAGESIRKGDWTPSYFLNEWEATTADWWGNKVKERDLVIRRIR